MSKKSKKSDKITGVDVFLALGFGVYAGAMGATLVRDFLDQRAKRAAREAAIAEEKEGRLEERISRIEIAVETAVAGNGSKPVG